MPRPSIQAGLARLGDSLAGLVEKALDALVPPPEPKRIPVRAQERR